MTKFKYNDGDCIGPHHINMIKRTKKDNQNKWLGLFQCPYCKKEFETRINSIQSGLTQSCGCWNKMQAKEKGRKIGKKYGGQKKKDLTNQNFGKLTALFIIGQTSNHKNIWHCRCECGNETNVVAGDLLSGKTQSCGCLVSKGEEKINFILQELKIKFNTQKTFNDCINPKTNTKLRFDFYLPDYNCCIEYDGKQHYISNWEPLRNIQYRDNLKNQYCINNNINLIRIPYTDFNSIDKKYILEVLNGLTFSSTS